MKKRALAIILTFAICLSALSACGSQVEEAKSEALKSTTAETEKSSESETEETTVASDDGMKELEVLGEVNVDKGLFNVTLNIPKDFVGEATQKELDELAKEKGYKSITLNSDGSATYVMNKAQHEELLSGIRDSINSSLQEMVGSEEYPNITKIEANDDFTSFTVTTKNQEPDFSESFGILALYMYGGMYGVFSGNAPDNVHVDFVNADSGEVVSSSDSRDISS
ncbi:hypothetical protein [Oribacterium sp. FC2011]|uniref:hypothetical protein n=1 Tax=Oribacterium sp. FC2011 TaxID=1408311 RepID=UPI0004E1E227|nr:hypothetical protein [Oribacterium sp. FC2011]